MFQKHCSIIFKNFQTKQKSVNLFFALHYQDNNKSCSTLDISLAKKNSCTTFLKESLLHSFWHLSGKKNILAQLSWKNLFCAAVDIYLAKKTFLHSSLERISLAQLLTSLKQNNTTLHNPLAKTTVSLLHIALVAKILWDQNLLYAFPFIHFWH